MTEIYLRDWQPVKSDRMLLSYSNGETLFITKKNFDDAFKWIISANYDDVKHNFAVDMR